MSEVTDSGYTLVRAEGVAPDDWQRFLPAEGAADALPPQGGRWLVPLALWLAHTDALRALGDIGVVIAPGDDVLRLEDRLDGLALVAVEFPAFVDGRGFSSGRLLRTRLGWQGEMRAVGDVLVDTVYYLARCGFDSFTVKPGHDAEHARRQFAAFSVDYQPQYVKPRELA